MIVTVFCSSPPHPETASHAARLVDSWAQAQQPGHLVQLTTKGGGEAVASSHPRARSYQAQSWHPHPYTGDLYPPYQKAAALFEWLFVEKPEGTILLLDPTATFAAPLTTRAAPGAAHGTAWPDLPQGDGPFGLGPGFAFLETMCVDTRLQVASVKLPVLIHTADLRRIAVRWLELMSLIRAETAATAAGRRIDADRIAYVIAAAEAQVPHAITDLGITTGDPAHHPRDSAPA